LLSNALKHAFPKGERGQVQVEFHTEGNRYQLRVSDNGVGLPQGVDFRRSATLGLQLVKTLVEQLEGEITLNSDAGTVFTVSFSGYKPEDPIERVP
jgi:two-component sensor histidine kinase